jgi:hypothetical protein
MPSSLATDTFDPAPRPPNDAAARAATRIAATVTDGVAGTAPADAARAAIAGGFTRGVQRQEAPGACPGYEPDERQRSLTEAGILADDVTQSSGRLVIAS